MAWLKLNEYEPSQSVDLVTWEQRSLVAEKIVKFGLIEVNWSSTKSTEASKQSYIDFAS